MFADAVYDRYDFDLRESTAFNKSTLKSHLKEAKFPLKENTHKLTLKEETILVAKEFIADLVKTCKDDLLERESVDLTNKLIAQLQKLLNESRQVNLQEGYKDVSKVFPDMRIKGTDINFFDETTGGIILPLSLFGDGKIPQVGEQVIIEFSDDWADDLQQYEVSLINKDEIELKWVTTILDGYYNTVEDSDLDLDLNLDENLGNFSWDDDEPFSIISCDESLQQNPFSELTDTVDLLKENDEDEDLPSGGISDLESYARLIYDGLMMREIMADVRVNEDEQFIEIVDNTNIGFDIIDQLVKDAVMIENVEPEIEVKSETSHVYRFTENNNNETGFGKPIPKWDE